MSILLEVFSDKYKFISLIAFNHHCFNVFLVMDITLPCSRQHPAVIVNWRIREKIIITVLYCIMYHSCDQSYMHSHIGSYR